jgi:hypothetical protein
MKTIGRFTLQGANMYAVAADDDGGNIGATECIFAVPLLGLACLQLQQCFDAVTITAPQFPEVWDFVPLEVTTTTGKETWRLFLGTDGSGEVSVFVDTGGKLNEDDIVGVDPMGPGATPRVWEKYRKPQSKKSQGEARTASPEPVA